MSLKITHKNAAFPSETEFDVTGIGLVENGKAKTLSKEDEEEFVARMGMTVKEYFKSNDNVKVEGTTELSSSEASTLAEGGGEG